MSGLGMDIEIIYKLLDIITDFQHGKSIGFSFVWVYRSKKLTEMN